MLINKFKDAPCFVPCAWMMCDLNTSASSTLNLDQDMEHFFLSFCGINGMFQGILSYYVIGCLISLVFMITACDLTLPVYNM